MIADLVGGVVGQQIGGGGGTGVQVASYTQSANQYVTGGGNIVMTKPSGLAAGDLLLFFGFGQQANALPVIGAEDGWQTTLGCGGNNSTDKWTVSTHKIADAADAAASNFTFTVNSPDNYHGVLLRITGAHPFEPVALEHYGNSAELKDTENLVASMAAPTFTPSDDLISGTGLAITVAGCNYNSDVATFSLSGTGWPTTPDIETTPVTAAEDSGGRKNCAAIAWQQVNVGSAIPAVTWSHDQAAAQFWTAMIYIHPDDNAWPDLSPFDLLGWTALGSNNCDSAVTLYFASDNTQESRLPVLPVNGDLLVAVKSWFSTFAWDDAAAGVPSGWTSLGVDSGTSDGDISLEVMYWVVTGTPAAGDTVTFPGSTTANTTDYRIDVVHISGADTTTPIDAEGSHTYHVNSGDSFTGGDVTTTQANCLAIRAGYIRDAASYFTAHPGNATIVTFSQEDWGSHHNSGPGLAVELVASAGAAGTATWTSTASSTAEAITKTVAIAPA